MFDSQKNHPKCKVSLNSRLSEPNEVLGPASSRSSLYSIPSIEWDGRCRSEYGYRTRSLPRQRLNKPKLYRTQSHSGFINSFIKDPEPRHYHLPRCRSCGTTNSSYVWELTKEQKMPTSLYFSVDNIPQKCKEEATAVKVKEKVVPVFKVAKVDTEFVDSQEFDEDNYLGEIGNSFSSDNQTVIEKVDVKDKTLVLETLEIAKEVVEPDNEEHLHRAELVTVDVFEDVNNNTVNSVEGEYHSFTEDLDFEESAYESPVKDLVEKDIRDYSVPIDFYCEDYSNKDGSSGKTVQKRSNTKGVLEPILEESKSSYGDESSKADEEIHSQDTVKIDEGLEAVNTSNHSQEPSIYELGEQNYRKIEFNAECLVDNVVMEVFSRAIAAVQLKTEMGTNNADKITTDVLETEIHVRERYLSAEEDSDLTTTDVESVSFIVQTAVDAYEEETDSQHILNSVNDNVFEILSSESISIVENNVTGDKKACSIELSAASSGVATKSFDSTVEFEKYEIIADLVASILSRIDFDETNVVMQNLPMERNFQAYFDVTNDQITYSDTSEKSVKKKDTTSQEMDSEKDSNNSENFSIAKIIHDMELNIDLNETVITEVSDTDNNSYKIIEAIPYYIFDRVFVYLTEKSKYKKQKNKKKVVTVVDSEDILYTAFNLWMDIDDSVVNKSFELNSEPDNNKDYNRMASVETCLNTSEKGNRASINLISDESGPNTEILKQINVDIANNDVDIDDVCDCFEDNANESDSFTQDTNAIPKYDTSNLNEEFQNESYETAGEIISEIFELSVNDLSGSVVRDNENCDATFVLEKDMNTAFVVDSYSRSSSPNKELSVFEICTESPIKNTNETFIGDDLSVLYEKDDTILGSPFIKKAPVIAMTQTAHSGGIKYWVSFDDSLTERAAEKQTFRTVRKVENKLPSFVTVDLRERNNRYEKDNFKPSSVLFLNQSDKKTDSFASCASVYTTCDEDNSKTENEPQKRLLYDSRILHTKVSKRQCSSWPPFEDTLFYRIISKFRMSESFDPSDFEHIQIENSF